MAVITLNNQQLKALHCPENKKQIKKAIGDGLFILVKSNGSKLWRFRYKYASKHQELAFGKYPNITLVKAKELASEARLQLIQGVNPAETRKQNKKYTLETDSTFLKVATKWWEQQKNGWSEDNARKIKRWLEVDASSIGKMHIEKVDAGHITTIMLALKKAGTPKKANPILSVLNRIFAFAIANGLVRNNPAQNIPLRDLIGPLEPIKHQAAITKPKILKDLILSIDENETGDFCTREALKLLPRLFLRPIEIRLLKWDYVDFKTKQINITPDEMKKGREHTVPLSSQALKQLLYINEHTKYSKYVFPSSRNGQKPISKNVLVNRLRHLGFDADTMTAHGFRSTASTILHEHGWDHNIIELQLAHLIGSETSRSYNRALFLPKRRKMMQFWADYLDDLKKENFE